MKKKLTFATLCLFALIGFIFAINFVKSHIMTNTAYASTDNPPPTGDVWKKIPLKLADKDVKLDLLYLEMPHGWIIKDGSGLTFVPKPR